MGCRKITTAEKTFAELKGCACVEDWQKSWLSMHETLNFTATLRGGSQLCRERKVSKISIFITCTPPYQYLELSLNNKRDKYRSSSTRCRMTQTLLCQTRRTGRKPMSSSAMRLRMRQTTQSAILVGNQYVLPHNTFTTSLSKFC